MNLMHSNLRWLLIPALVLNMGASGIVNCLQIDGNCGSPISKSHKTPVCCCCRGGCHGQCGMACCQKPATNQDQLPPQPRSHDDFGSTFGLATFVAAGIDFATAGALQHGAIANLATAEACPSLLALNVRFNV
jgi:hypothetical protein